MFRRTALRAVAALLFCVAAAPPDSTGEIDRLWEAYRASRGGAERLALERGIRWRLRARWRRLWPGPLADSRERLADPAGATSRVESLSWSLAGANREGSLSSNLIAALDRLRDRVRAVGPSVVTELEVDFAPPPGVPARPESFHVVLRAYGVR